MRKIINRTMLLYVLYGLVMYWYLFYGSHSGIPSIYQGTSADPATFMNGRELVLSTEYSRIKDLLLFLATPFEWMVVFFFLLSGLSTKIEHIVRRRIPMKILQMASYYFFFTLFVFICTLPFQLIGYMVSKSYHISVQSFPQWMKEQLLDFGVNFIIMVIVVQVLFSLIKRWKHRWWIYGWLLSTPFTLFLTFIQPVLLDPLYNEFSPVQNKELETKILTMAQEANIPAKHVYEVQMSDQTNALNAYVTGIGANARIVLWDTTINRLSEDEILFIMAHEMSHYVKHHIYWGIGFGILLSFFGFYLVHRAISRIGKRRSGLEESFAVIPVILLLTSLLTFMSTPITNIFSRYEEKVSDAYAIEMTGDKEAGIETFHSLAKASLSEVDPPYLVKVFLYTHPTILERITALEEK